MNIRFSAAVCGVAALLVATVSAAPAHADDCTVFNGARGDRHNLGFFTLYQIRVTTSGFCSQANLAARAEAPLVCAVEGLYFGAATVLPPVIVGAGVADPRQSNDTCSTFSGSALSAVDCTLWSVTGRHFRAASQVGIASGPEIACAP